MSETHTRVSALTDTSKTLVCVQIYVYTAFIKRIYLYRKKRLSPSIQHSSLHLFYWCVKSSSLG